MYIVLRVTGLKHVSDQLQLVMLSDISEFTSIYFISVLCNYTGTKLSCFYKIFTYRIKMWMIK